jgi:hypothetical protein
VNARFVKPLDESLIVKTARRAGRVFTLEEHSGAGGFGSAVLELLAERGILTPVTVLGLPDCFVDHGSTDQLLDACDLSTDKIVARILTESRSPDESTPEPILRVDQDKCRQAINEVRELTLPEDLGHWAQEYGTVGHRDSFLWNWCLQGVRLTALSCVADGLRDQNDVTKVLGVMLDVLLDDVADESKETEYLEQLLKIPFAGALPDFSSFSAAQQDYARVTCRLWDTILSRVRAYPRFSEFEELLRFDYAQLLNTMRYSNMLNRNVHLLNLAEHDLYLPHNMHMMVSGTMDLMCSPDFDASELGTIREALWRAQCMGRVGNLVTTWERELRERDFTSGVFARAVQLGVLSSEHLASVDVDELREAIRSSDCENHFLRQWRSHRKQLDALAGQVRTVDVARLAAGLEELITIHLGSRGLK